MAGWDGLAEEFINYLSPRVAFCAVTAVGVIGPTGPPPIRILITHSPTTKTVTTARTIGTTDEQQRPLSRLESKRQQHSPNGLARDKYVDNQEQQKEGADQQTSGHRASPA